MKGLIPRILLGILCPVLFSLLPNILNANCITDFKLIDQTEIDYDPEDLEYGCTDCFDDDDDDDEGGSTDEWKVFEVTYSIEVKNKNVRWIEFSMENGLLEYDYLSIFGRGIYECTIKIAFPADEEVEFKAKAIKRNGDRCGRRKLTLSPNGLEGLPVELISFLATEQTDGNLIQWSTATEENTSHFIIESSTNGQDWNAIDKIDAVGFTTQLQSYHTLDRNAEQLTYYRLRTVDYDGLEELSEIIAVERKDILINVPLQAFPVPTINQPVTINYRSSLEEEVSIRLIDQSGKIIRQFAQQMNKGLNTFTMDLTDEATGFYLLTILATGKQQTTRLVKG